MTQPNRTHIEPANTAPPKKRSWWRSPAVIVIGLLFAAAVFVWLGWGVAENWDTLSMHLSQASPWLLALAVALQLVFTLCIGLCYYNGLRLAGAVVRVPPAIGVYLASQLGKFVPGYVLYVAGHIGLATWLRISPTQAILGFTAHHIFLVAMGMAAAGPLLGLLVEQRLMVVILIMAVIGVIVLASGLWVKPFNAFQRKRRKPELETFSASRAFAGLLSAGCGWVTYACIAVVFASILHPGLSPAASMRIGMASVAGWLMGFLSFFAPAGVGVREGVFVLLTRSIIQEPTAMAVALLMRVLYTVLQVSFGAIALTYSIRARPDRTPGGTP
jgi:uncharacterized membrane protein YbhN (UPF0104 family)